MDEQNGEAKMLPTIQVGWDADTQEVHLQFSPQDFKKWEFVIACLNMAVAKAEHTQKVNQVMAMQREAQAQAQNEAQAAVHAQTIRRSLGR